MRKAGVRSVSSGLSRKPLMPIYTITCWYFPTRAGSGSNFQLHGRESGRVAAGRHICRAVAALSGGSLISVPITSSPGHHRLGRLCRDFFLCAPETLSQVGRLAARFRLLRLVAENQPAFRMPPCSPAVFHGVLALSPGAAAFLNRNNAKTC